MIRRSFSTSFLLYNFARVRFLVQWLYVVDMVLRYAVVVNIMSTQIINKSDTFFCIVLLLKIIDNSCSVNSIFHFNHVACTCTVHIKNISGCFQPFF